MASPSKNRSRLSVRFLVFGVALLFVLAATLLIRNHLAKGGAAEEQTQGQEQEQELGNASGKGPTTAKSDDPAPLEFPCGLTGVVTAVSPVPDPQTNPYPNCASTILVTLRDGNEVLITGPAFDARALLAHGRLLKGQSARFWVVPEPDAPEELKKRFHHTDAINRFDIETRYWAFHTNIVGRPLPLQTAEQESPSLEKQYLEESHLIRDALLHNPSPLFGGVSNEFFFQGLRDHYKPDFWKTPPRDPALLGVRDMLLQFHEILNERGVELYVALPPINSSVFPDMMLNTYFDPEHHDPPNQTIRDLLHDLREQGVSTVDLMPSFLAERWFEYQGKRYPVIRPNDTHWSSYGARLAATRFAQEVRSSTKYADALDQLPADTLEEKIEVIEMDSDIAEMIQRNRPHWKVTVKPHSSPAYRVRVRGKGSERDETTMKAMVPGEHPGAAIQLIGDSFAQNLAPMYSGLHAHLTKELGAPIHLYFRYASGGTICRDWLATDHSSSAKIVILVLGESYTTDQRLWPKFAD